MQLPGSKSLSNRLLLLSALSKGTTTIHNILLSEDTEIMLHTLKQLGVSVSCQGDIVTINSSGVPLGTSENITLHLGVMFCSNV